MSLENTSAPEEVSLGEFSILKYVKSEILVNLWIAAYFEKRIKKKQLMAINIDESVQEIIRVTNSDDGWIPFRISGGLLTGVVKLFYHKVEYLDSKCTTIFTRMQNFSKSLNSNTSSQASGKVSSKEAPNSKIDRPQNHSKLIRGVIDIEEINRALDDINEDAISQLEMVPLSQASQQNESLAFELPPSPGDCQDSYQLGSMPIILDMEFDDFINEREVPDVEMEIEDRVIVNESGVEIDLEANIEKRRGASIDFSEVLANGLEEIGSSERGKFPELDRQSEFLDLDDRQEYRGSINSFKESSVSGSNRNSIGGFSAALDLLEDSGNRLSISAVAENILEIPGLDGTTTLSLPEISKSIKVNEAYSGRPGTKRMKIVEIPQDMLTFSRPLQNGSRGLIPDFLMRSFDLKLRNLVDASKNSDAGVLSLSRNLPLRLSSVFAPNKENNPRNPRKRLSQRGGKSVSSFQPAEEIPDSLTEYSPSFEEVGDLSGKDSFDYPGSEEQNATDEPEMKTPVRGGIVGSQESERDELTYTPWTNYISTDRRKAADTPANAYYDERKIQSLFSSRELKTMQYLESKFLKSERIGFDDLVRGSDATVVAPIFVQILHLKSKSMIDIKQSEPFGEIIISPVTRPV
ncbi:RAD21-N-terminal like protein [Cryptosporidium canis]|uniref:RAD21-N-terminal like protein n=1 Tax=Cryptosporidium canis TaxID=195482 RepID=A0ABQ8P6V3_9CRYT|nr:RAD21-N-terminal like protein [Cryptosporidium canis]